MNNNLQVWEKIFQENEWGKYPALSVIKFVARNFYHVNNRKEVKILEIGSGTGANLWFCAREGFSVIGLEGSQTAIDRMKERFTNEKLTDFLLDVKCGDYFDTLDDIEDDSIDAILDLESLYCNSFKRSKKIVEKLFNKLKSGGVMLSQTFTDGTWGLDGKEIDYHTVLPKEGPMANMGTGRYVTKNDIEKLYKLNNNTITNIERFEQHLNNRKIIKEWIIELRKN